MSIILSEDLWSVSLIGFIVNTYSFVQFLEILSFLYCQKNLIDIFILLLFRFDFSLVLLGDVLRCKHFNYWTWIVDLYLKLWVLVAFSKHEYEATRYHDLIGPFEYLWLFDNRHFHFDHLLSLDISNMHLQHLVLFVFLLCKHHCLVPSGDGIRVPFSCPLFVLDLSLDDFVPDGDLETPDHPVRVVWQLQHSLQLVRGVIQICELKRRLLDAIVGYQVVGHCM